MAVMTRAWGRLTIPGKVIFVAIALVVGVVGTLASHYFAYARLASQVQSPITFLDYLHARTTSGWRFCRYCRPFCARSTRSISPCAPRSNRRNARLPSQVRSMTLARARSKEKDMLWEDLLGCVAPVFLGTVLLL